MCEKLLHAGGAGADHCCGALHTGRRRCDNISFQGYRSACSRMINVLSREATTIMSDPGVASAAAPQPAMMCVIVLRFAWGSASLCAFRLADCQPRPRGTFSASRFCQRQSQLRRTAVAVYHQADQLASLCLCSVRAHATSTFVAHTLPSCTLATYSSR